MEQGPESLMIVPERQVSGEEEENGASGVKWQKTLKVKGKEPQRSYETAGQQLHYQTPGKLTLIHQIWSFHHHQAHNEPPDSTDDRVIGGGQGRGGIVLKLTDSATESKLLQYFLSPAVVLCIAINIYNDQYQYFSAEGGLLSCPDSLSKH